MTGPAATLFVVSDQGEGLLVRATVHAAGGVYPGWVGWVSADSPWVQENLGKTLFLVEENEPPVEVEAAPVEQEIEVAPEEGGWLTIEAAPEEGDGLDT